MICPNNTWNNINEKKPKRGQPCLVKINGITQYMAVVWDGVEFVWADGWDSDGVSAFDPIPSEVVTQWMYLP